MFVQLLTAGFRCRDSEPKFRRLLLGVHKKIAKRVWVSDTGSGISLLAYDRKPLPRTSKSIIPMSATLFGTRHPKPAKSTTHGNFQKFLITTISSGKYGLIEVLRRHSYRSFLISNRSNIR